MRKPLSIPARHIVPISSANRTPQALAYALQSVEQRQFKRLTCLPFNRSEHETTTWWLSPSTDNPAYRHGKIGLEAQFARPSIFVGFYVEKGIGESAAATYNDTPARRRMIMDESWLWHRFEPDLGSGKVEPILASIEELSGRAVFIGIDTAQEGSEDPDAVCLSYSGGALTHVASDCPGRILTDVAASGTISDLHSRLSALPDRDWTWLDMFFGFVMSGSGDWPGTEWSTEDIWTNAGAPWTGWLS